MRERESKRYHIVGLGGVRCHPSGFICNTAWLIIFYEYNLPVWGKESTDELITTTTKKSKVTQTNLCLQVTWQQVKSAQTHFHEGGFKSDQNGKFAKKRGKQVAFVACNLIYE